MRVFYCSSASSKGGSLDPVETNHGLRDRASFSWRYDGPVREIACSSPSEQKRPPGRPDLPRRRTLGGRLDDHGRARLEGELGAVPGPDPPAENEARY